MNIQNMDEVLRKLSAGVLDLKFPMERFPMNAVSELLRAAYIPEDTADGFLSVLKRAVNGRDREMCALLLEQLALELIRGYGHRVFEDFQNTIQNAFSENVRLRFSDSRQFQGRGVIYTVLTGKYEELKEPVFVDKQFDYVCFTDDAGLKSNVWKFRLLKDGDGLDPQRMSRKPKILCCDYLEEYDFSVYVDSKFRIIGNLGAYIEKYARGASLLAFPHYSRNCVYEEAEACINLQKDKQEIISAQVEKYRKEGMPVHFGLIDAGYMVRSHRDTKLRQMLNTWWSEFIRGCRRDQISFPYACWKNQYYYDVCNLYSENNEYLKLERDMR